MTAIAILRILLPTASIDFATLCQIPNDGKTMAFSSRSTWRATSMRSMLTLIRRSNSPNTINRNSFTIKLAPMSSANFLQKSIKDLLSLITSTSSLPSLWCWLALSTRNSQKEISNHNMRNKCRIRIHPLPKMERGHPESNCKALRASSTS